MPDDALLKASLEMAVPLQCWEIKRLTFEERREIAERAVQMITEKGDLILYRSKKKGETAKAWAALVKGLACLAFMPGGVKVFGIHFEWDSEAGTCRCEAINKGA